ncbi:aminotransferase class V-fold PLP-dependent enzyme [Photobacterium sp. WH77]|uniref:aminotransferase class V-fold PLP-dependent enzyme n=1 Tax=unclassified Photobacterium TaxID=2628852 RepID=UPI001EDA216F|nr:MULTISPECIES: aminotransferase class V-fold PLP-dependent enzyme [unclassified Photobacterium]MCG2839065.1 aminotransferase class V-fold PLP-dependent enzyme [Photobacterium sp. WH77]MCG2846682.1 aminotransferase class V-fold PLP-dependent enzyme [Photobacterium sp. WH80]
MLLNKDYLRQSVIGDQWPVHTPFGIKPLVYADHTASGRSLSLIEQFIQDQVMPFYGNTHTETSLTGRQTTFLREQSRRIIRKALNASEEQHVIFTGSGATSAINRFIHLLDLPRYQEHKPVVFIGGYEHHSNDLPWREANVKLVRIPLNAAGDLDLDALREQLTCHQSSPLLIGSFSAASNVTGIKTDVKAVTALLKSFGALACWDFAAAAPYVPIDMQAIPMDAVFISPHKFLGGPGTPGLLVVRRGCFQQRLPGLNGGGTVSYVNADMHHYVEDIERREEGGTPAIIESIRAGLVFKIQQQIGLDYIEQREKELVEQAFTCWASIPKLDMLGSQSLERLAIFSFNIKQMHYGVVVAMLNDLFGIQARGGCSCAGPYAHHLLGISSSEAEQNRQKLQAGDTQSRPGWVRLNLHYLFDQKTVDYILEAVSVIANQGHLLLPYYHYHQDKGVWLYQHHQPQLTASLDHFDTYSDNSFSPPESMSDAMSNAKSLFEQLRNTPAHRLHSNDATVP